MTTWWCLPFTTWWCLTFATWPWFFWRSSVIIAFFPFPSLSLSFFLSLSLALSLLLCQFDFVGWRSPSSRGLPRYYWWGLVIAVVLPLDELRQASFSSLNYLFRIFHFIVVDILNIFIVNSTPIIIWNYNIIFVVVIIFTTCPWLFLEFIIRFNSNQIL